MKNKILSEYKNFTTHWNVSMDVVVRIKNYMNNNYILNIEKDKKSGRYNFELKMLKGTGFVSIIEEKNFISEMSVIKRINELTFTKTDASSRGVPMDAFKILTIPFYAAALKATAKDVSKKAKTFEKRFAQKIK